MKEMKSFLKKNKLEHKFVNKKKVLVMANGELLVLEKNERT